MSDRRDPVCGMQGIIEHDGQWFCSQHCIEVYERWTHQEKGCCPEPRAPNPKLSGVLKRWWMYPWIWVPLSGGILGTAGLWFPPADQTSAIYISYLQKVFVPLLLGLVLGGMIDHFIPREYVAKLLAGPRKRVILRSTLLGFLASSCSHGCLALTIELYRKGASTPAVVSFLLASPWASMSFTFMLLSLFGLKGTVIVLGALVIAFITGLIFQRLALRSLIEINPHTALIPDDFSIRHDLLMKWRQYRFTPRQILQDVRGVIAGMRSLGRMVLGWVQLGLILSSVIGALIPTGIFERFLGPSLGGLLLTLLAATMIEVCSEGTAPLAFELYRHTGALGNAFAFLMGGVVTDYTELGALWTNIGRRTVLWMLIVTLPLVVAFGLMLNRWG